MKKQLLALTLVLLAVLAMALPVSALATSGETQTYVQYCTFIYYGAFYRVTTYGGTVINDAYVYDIKNSLKTANESLGLKKDSGDTVLYNIQNPVLCRNIVYLQDDNATVKYGDTIYVYNSSTGVNVHFDNIDYFVQPGGTGSFSIDAVKKQLNNSLKYQQKSSFCSRAMASPLKIPYLPAPKYISTCAVLTAITPIKIRPNIQRLSAANTPRVSTQKWGSLFSAPMTIKNTSAVFRATINARTTAL